MMIEKIILAKPRGFCAGVARAVDVVDKALEIYGAPVYVKHAIVHNVHVIADLEKKGAVFVESVAEIPEGSYGVFSAHGSPPEHYEQAKARHLKLIDATCPLVNKVHLEAKLFSGKNIPIVYVGHRGHPEGIGVGGEVAKLGGEFYLIDNLEEAQAFSLDRDTVAILTQTTLSMSDVKEILAVLLQKFPNAQFPPQKDICYATENRQTAIKALAKQADTILVIGSKTSSNSNRLREVAEANGAKAYLIDDVSFINPAWVSQTKVLGISAGASAPERLVQEVIQYFANENVPVTELTTIEEQVFFPLPAALKNATILPS